MTAHEYRLASLVEMQKASVLAQAYQLSGIDKLVDLSAQYVEKASKYTEKAKEYERNYGV